MCGYINTRTKQLNQLKKQTKLLIKTLEPEEKMFNLLGSLLFGNRSAERSHTQTNDVNTQEDWDIVDRSEEADKLKAEPVVYGPEPAPGVLERAEDDNDVILGSFFERNEHSTDDQERYKARTYDDDEMPEVRSKDWLITPLPCLTSITASQRSVTENSELENLLIEHPSMSVFVTATSTSIIESIDSPVSSKLCLVLYRFLSRQKSISKN